MRVLREDGEDVADRIPQALASPEADVIVVGHLEVRVKARSVHWRGRGLDLSPKEFEVLRLLAESQGQVLSRQAIWNGAWPEYRIPPQINVIDVNMSRLRAKLEQAAKRPLIVTVRKQGFVLKADPA